MPRELKTSLCRRSRRAGMVVGVVSVAGALGCASVTPSRELAAARSKLEEARSSAAAEYAPAYLIDARNQLQKAEAAHEADPGSYQEQHHAYLALRGAQMAIAKGNAELARRDQSVAETEYAMQQERVRRQVEERLGSMEATNRTLWLTLQQANQELDNVRRQMAEERSQGQGTSERVRELEERERELEIAKAELAAQIEGAQKELERERTARQEAEARADKNLERLREVAQVRENGDETRITVSGSVLFRTDDASILPTAERTLSRVADALKDQDADKKIIVEGHTDSRGTAGHNRELAEQRAESVRSFLIQEGVPPERISARGVGESQPVAPNESPEGRALNRRVEIIIGEQGG